MSLEDRKYQDDAIEAAEAYFDEGHLRIVAVGPTGCGKTAVAAKMIIRALRKGMECMFLAHRKELIDQTSLALTKLGVSHGVIMGKHALTRPDAKVQVASIQSLQAKRKCMSCNDRESLKSTCNLCGGTGKEISRKLPKANLIIVDEAHRVMGDGYTALLQKYPEARVLAITATPWRLDGQGLGGMFSKMVVIANMQELIDQKYLLPPRLFGPPQDIDLKGIRMIRRDYDTEQLGDRMKQETLVGNIVDHYQELANGERAVAFAVNVAHSREIMKRFVERGIACEHLDGETPKAQREAILSRLASGQTRVVTNVDVLVEGWDLPSLHCVILARPTKSITRYLQQVGRAMRPYGDQRYALILDHANCVKDHKLPQMFRAWSLEDRKPEGRPKGPKVEAEFVPCPKCEQYMRAGGACSHCNPQLFADLFQETDHKLIEYRHVEQLEIEIPKPIDVKIREKRRLNAPCMFCAGTKVRQKVYDQYKVKRSCPDCKEIEYTIDEEAVARASEEQRRAEWRRLETVRVEKGFKPGWTAHQYKATFGSWPPAEFQGRSQD